MNIGEQIVTQLLEQSTPIVALYPGKFKPPHAGHFDVVAKAANIADKVIVIMSQGSKDEFTPEDSMKVWNLYKDILPSNVENLLFKIFKHVEGVILILLYQLERHISCFCDYSENEN